MGDIVDLDALVPPETKIKFAGQEIIINPPKTGDVLAIGQLAQKLTNFANQTEIELDKTTADLVTKLKKVIPELANHELNTQQILKLVAMISDMAIPADAKELAERGITVGNGDPKAPTST